MADLQKEYKRIEFGLDDKKTIFHFKKTGGRNYYSKISLSVHMPDSFEYAGKVEVSSSELKIYIKGGADGDTHIYDVTQKANDERSCKIKAEPTEQFEVLETLRVLFVWEMLADGTKRKSKSDFRPDTVGGGILVGTGE